MTDKRIFLGMPGYGKQTQAAGRALWRACADMNRVYVSQQVGSLLASNFNQLWCEALNLVNEGKRVDYFAMLHDDIGAEDGWLDSLIAELEAQELDVLQVVVPIKDSRGMTSMALHKEGDNWMPHCRLSMRDVFELPETFTSDDLGRKLLLNTGCWVCKFNIEWAKRVHFEINDRIVFNRSCLRYQAQTEPEDWGFSRQLHEVGQGPTSHLPPLKIGATRKVKIIHQGEVIVGNDSPWGSQWFDVEATATSPVPGAFPYEVTGWLRAEEGKYLAELASGKRVLEIGSYCGLSTICLARTAEHVTAVDYFDGRATPVPQETRSMFDANIARYGLTNVEVCYPNETLPLAEYDLAFIDGAHDADSVAADADRAISVLATDGLLVFHDYHKITDPGVTQVVDAIVANGGTLVSVHESLAVVKPPALIPLEV